MRYKHIHRHCYVFCNHYYFYYYKFEVLENRKILFLPGRIAFIGHLNCCRECLI